MNSGYMNRDGKSRIRNSPACSLVKFQWNYVPCNNKNNSSFACVKHGEYTILLLFIPLSLVCNREEGGRGGGCCGLPPRSHPQGWGNHFLSCQEHWSLTGSPSLGITLREWSFLTQGHVPYPATMPELLISVAEGPPQLHSSLQDHWRPLLHSIAVNFPLPSWALPPCILPHKLPADLSLFPGELN